MKKKSFTTVAILCACISGLAAQTVIKSGVDKIEVKGKNVKISSDGLSSQQSSGNIIITGSGKDETYNGNEKNVTISGSNNHIRITGYPNVITVAGSNNAIYTDGAKSITASGSSNSVIYYNLINKQKPSISISGQNNSVLKKTI